jgi:FkbM family methyltransferase
MLLRFLKNVFGASPPREPGKPSVLERFGGVIHVGANIGQERDLYQAHGLAVIWIEPIPDVFDQLSARIEGYPRQRALQCLLTDRDGVEYAFHVASNGGESSSILELAKHRDIWPEIGFERTIRLTSTTLKSLVEREPIDLAVYDTLVLDTQGAELLVLRGAAEHVRAFRFIETEIADFEAYAGCCQLPEMARFMEEHGFAEIRRIERVERRHPDGGSYYDILYERIDTGRK